MSLFAARVVVFSVATCLTTTWFYGWPHLSYILLRARTYCWLCNDGIDHCTGAVPAGKFYLEPCHEQSVAVQSLYTLATSTEYALSILPGIVYDNVGVRFCGGLGLFLFICGWVTLNLSSQSLPLYPLAFFLFGHGVNYVGLGCVSLSEYTVNYVYLTMSISMAAQQLAFVIPAVLWNLVLSNPDKPIDTVLAWYWAAVALPAGLLFVMFLPAQRRIRPRRLSSMSIKDGATWRDFGKLVRDPTYLTFVAWYATINMAMNSVMTNMVEVMGQSVASFYGWVSWLPLGPFLGVLNDYVHSIWSLWGVTLCQVLILIAFMVDSDAYHYFAVSILAVSLGYVHALKVYYINENFPKEHLGKLVGFASLVSGLLQLANILVASSAIPIKMEFGFWLVFGAVQLLMISYLHDDYRNPQRRMHILEEVRAKNL